jgi:hypothetical protein
MGKFTIYDLRLGQDLTPSRKEAEAQGGTPPLQVTFAPSALLWLG